MDGKINSLESHPKDPALMLCTTKQGHAVMWNIYIKSVVFGIEALMTEFKVPDEILTVDFHPSGHEIIFGNSAGRIMTYGIDCGQNDVPEEQFVSQDFDSVYDRDGKLFCEQAGILASLVDQGSLMNKARDVYTPWVNLDSSHDVNIANGQNRSRRMERMYLEAQANFAIRESLIEYNFFNSARLFMIKSFCMEGGGTTSLKATMKSKAVESVSSLLHKRW